MPRSSAVYKETYNRCLDYLAMAGLKTNLPPETEFAKQWGISRTTVRAILERLNRTGLIDWDGRRKTILRLPTESDYFTADETRTTAEKVETTFMELVLGGDLAPGTILRESELARQFGTSPSAVREFLIGFSRFGLIEKEPNRHWKLRGFTRRFAVELFDVRELFETRGFEALLARGETAPILAMRDDHAWVLEDIANRFLDFPRLDEAFHRRMIEALNNRFAEDFFAIVPMIFHYHYRWDKADERERNQTASQEHLAVIDALAMRDHSKARNAFKAHLATARRTLLHSVRWDDET